MLCGLGQYMISPGFWLEPAGSVGHAGPAHGSSSSWQASLALASKRCCWCVWCSPPAAPPAARQQHQPKANIQLALVPQDASPEPPPWLSTEAKAEDCTWPLQSCRHPTAVTPLAATLLHGPVPGSSERQRGQRGLLPGQAAHSWHCHTQRAPAVPLFKESHQNISLNIFKFRSERR